MSVACNLPSKCSCSKTIHSPKRIVITGGPGAGKTALLAIAQQSFCEHISILPEAASILFNGGFWRSNSLPGKKAIQRAIFHVQHELETLVQEEGKSAIVLCDRGTLDGLAYWPQDETLFWKEVGSSEEMELLRYEAVIHLRTPSLEQGYNYSNPARTETVQLAKDIDDKIARIWAKHPNRIMIDSSLDFLDKAKLAMDQIFKFLPECCRSHQIRF